MEDTTYLSNAESVTDSSTALKSLIKKHHQFLTDNKKQRYLDFSYLLKLSIRFSNDIVFYMHIACMYTRMRYSVVL